MYEQENGLKMLEMAILETQISKILWEWYALRLPLKSSRLRHF